MMVKSKGIIKQLLCVNDLIVSVVMVTDIVVAEEQDKRSS